MSWPGARKVLVPVAVAVALGAGDGAAAVAGTGALGEPADAGEPAGVGDPAGVLAALAAGELLDELQAGTSKAAPASKAAAVTRRAPGEFAINMIPHSSTFHSGSASHATSTTSAAAPRLEPLCEGLNHGPFGMNITAGTGDGGQRTERTRVIVAAAASEARPASAKSDG